MDCYQLDRHWLCVCYHPLFPSTHLRSLSFKFLKNIGMRCLSVFPPFSLYLLELFLRKVCFAVLRVRLQGLHTFCPRCMANSGVCFETQLVNVSFMYRLHIPSSFPLYLTMMTANLRPGRSFHLDLHICPQLHRCPT